MKFILSLLFVLVLFTPTFANNICANLSQNDCNNTAGCGDWDEDFGCTQCQSGTASAAGETTCASCPTGFDNGWSAQHKTHPYGASSCSDWECETGYFQYGNYCIACDPANLPNFAIYPENISNCDNWICDTGYYKGGANSDQCLSCPNNANTCVSGSTAENITCQTGFIKSITNGVVTCSTCPEHAEQSGNTCICSAGYYGDGNSSCTACPAGTTTSSAGATSDADCHMTSNTKFYDSTGENYMLLIPSTATNIQ